MRGQSAQGACRSRELVSGAVGGGHLAEIDLSRVLGERTIEGSHHRRGDAVGQGGERIEPRVRREVAEPLGPTLGARHVGLEHSHHSRRDESADDRTLGWVFGAALEDGENVAELGFGVGALEPHLLGDLLDVGGRSVTRVGVGHVRRDVGRDLGHFGRMRVRASSGDRLRKLPGPLHGGHRYWWLAGKSTSGGGRWVMEKTNARGRERIRPTRVPAFARWECALFR